jgi:PTS system mannose-specific IID component
MSRLTGAAVAATFVRSFFVQAAWNYHTMLGTGFAFALLPGLRRIHRGDRAGFEQAVARHVDHFNAHPYLSGVALGATLRLEDEGVAPETVARFKTAVRGPLGSLGDRLVWARWLPLVALSSLVLFWLGARWVAVTGLFLVVYNVGHLSLRAWALRVGLASGRDVTGRLADARLADRATALGGPVALALGALAGALLAGPLAAAQDGGLWVGVAVGAFLVGLRWGHRTWRPAAVAAVVVVAGILILGVLR